MTQLTRVDAFDSAPIMVPPCPRTPSDSRPFGIFLAVIRRRVTAGELSSVVPECCGRVWTAVRAQSSREGRHVAIYGNDNIDVEVGVELEGPFEAKADVILSATPGGT